MNELTSYDFLKIVQESLSYVVDYIDNNCADFLIDIEENDGVLKIDFVQQKKVFVVNRNLYLKELWYSSSVSGPHHFKYDLSSKNWINKDFEFFTLIYSEIDYVLHTDK